MARTPLGTKPQSQTRTALFAYVAAQLAGIPIRAFDETFRAWGLAVRQDGASGAASLVKEQPLAKRRRGRQPSRRTAVLDAAVRDWLLIDELRLGIELAILRFPGDGTPQADLIRRLRATPGVRQLLETAHKRDVVAIVLFSGARGRQEVRAQVDEIAERVIWDDVLSETWDPAARTWRALALAAAAEEELLEPGVRP
jgi:hypothetical protein